MAPQDPQRRPQVKKRQRAKLSTGGGGLAEGQRLSSCGRRLRVVSAAEKAEVKAEAKAQAKAKAAACLAVKAVAKAKAVARKAARAGAKAVAALAKATALNAQYEKAHSHAIFSQFGVPGAFGNH